MKTYLVIAYQDGDESNGNHYVVGIYSTKELALEAANSEEQDRGEKYGCQVTEWTVDQTLENAGFKAPQCIKSANY